MRLVVLNGRLDVPNRGGHVLSRFPHIFASCFMSVLEFVGRVMQVIEMTGFLGGKGQECIGW